MNLRAIRWLCLLMFMPLRVALGVDLNTDAALKCWLRFEEGSGTNAGDSSGNSHPGTLTGGPAWTTGKVGSGVDLAGDDDRVVVTHHSDLSPANVTVALWINLDTWSGTLTAPVSKQSSPSPYPAWDVRRSPSATTLEVSVASGGNNYTAVGSTPPTSAWQCVAFTYDGETLRIYQDGSETGQDTSPSGNLSSSSVDLWIGGNPTFSSGRYTDGKADEFRCYDRALTAAEVLSLYSFPRGYVPPEFLQTMTRMNGGFRND